MAVAHAAETQGLPFGLNTDPHARRRAAICADYDVARMAKHVGYRSVWLTPSRSILFDATLPHVVGHVERVVRVNRDADWPRYANGDCSNRVSRQNSVAPTARSIQVGGHFRHGTIFTFRP